MATLVAPPMPDRPWKHISKEEWVDPPPKPKPKKKGKIFVDWEKIGAIDVTPEGGKYSEKQLGIRPTPKEKREYDWRGRVGQLESAMAWLTEWCWEPLLDMHPEDKIATHDILVFADENGISAEVVKALKTEWPGGDPDDMGYGSKWGRGGCGAGRVKVVKKSIHELSERKLRRELDQGWDMVIVGYAMDLPETNSAADVIKKQTEVMKFMFDLGQIMVNDPDQVKKLVVLSSDLFSNATQLHEEFGVGVVANSTLAGYTNALRVELETTPILHLDLDWYLDDSMMESVALEILRPGIFGVNQVRLGAKGRYVARMMSHHQYDAEMPPEEDKNAYLTRDQKFKSFLKPHKYTDGVVALSGGNGALAMVMVIYMIGKMDAEQKEKATTKFLFLSRSAKVPETQTDMWKRVTDLVKGTNMEAIQCKCDVSKPDAVNAFIKEHTPHLKGFVHAAGILRDNVLEKQTWQDFEDVFAPKARGALYVHEALEKFENPDLHFFWLFSSLASLGSRGQSNYSAANAFLNGLARHRVAVNKPCCSIMWGAWGEAGMAAQLPASVKKRYADGPLPFFTNAEGLQGLDETLSTGLPVIGVWKFNPTALKAMGESDDDGSASLYMRTFYSRISPLECYFSYPYEWMDEYTACVDFAKVSEVRDDPTTELVKPHFKYNGITDKDPERLDSVDGIWTRKDTRRVYAGERGVPKPKPLYKGGQVGNSLGL